MKAVCVTCPDDGLNISVLLTREDEMDHRTLGRSGSGGSPLMEIFNSTLDDHVLGMLYRRFWFICELD